MSTRPPAMRNLSEVESLAFWAGAANLASFAIVLWTYSGQGNNPHCDWYCGPAPYIVAILSIPLTIGTILVAATASVLAFLGRHWWSATASAFATLSPILWLTILALVARM